jgi:predicted pyridoxine 5'-phosphate oxidase superfamily flavin-nucleotide-binding protein
VAFSESVKRIQRERGSRGAYERMERQRGGFATTLTPEIAAYIEERDSAYLATANAAGQPYVQHRGGPPGFIKVLDSKTIAFADFTGNRQYITTGNLAENDRAMLFLMNYAAGERVKIWGRAHVVLEDQALFARLADRSYDGRIEQAVVLEVSAWDVNCPQHIPKLIHAASVESELNALQRRVAYLEATLREANVAFALEERPAEAH